MSVKDKIRTLYQAVIFTIGVSAFTFAMTRMHYAIWGGFTAFLTLWSHVLHFIYFGVSLVHSLFGSEKTRKFNNFTNGLFSVSFTLSTIVGILFWGIYVYDRELIFPSSLDAHYPHWLNFYQHGFVAVFIWIEILFGHRRNISATSDHLLLFIFTTLYLSWITVVSRMDRWPYPFQKGMSLWDHIVFDTFAIIVSILVINFKRIILIYIGTQVNVTKTNDLDVKKKKVN